MYKTFKTRAASFSCQHLALAFTLIMSFFFNTLLMAQVTEVSVTVDISTIRTGENFLENVTNCYFSQPTGPVTQSYNFNVTYYNNTSEAYDVTIDLGSGGSHPITPGISTFSVTFPSYQTVPISVTGGGSPWYGELKRFPNRAMASYTYKSPDETGSIAVSTPNGSAAINMHTMYAPSNYQRKLKKPLIFVEGIDFPKEIVHDMAGKAARVGNFGWDTFITGMVDDPESSDNATFAKLPDFVNQMLAQGYDIVFCDFQDGTALIENNGRALIAVIELVNRRKKEGLSSKQTCYTNTLVGASMGGQVARWALKTMENENIDHDCGLYYSMDSPHKGANIPLALQAFVRFNATNGPEDGTKKEMRNLWNDLNLPAAKQLIAFHLGTNGEHPAYMSMMNQLGYPQKTRNIASANGSGNGQNQGYANNGLLMRVKGTESIFGGTPLAIWYSLFDLSLNASGHSRIADFSRIFEKPKLSLNPHVPLGYMRLERLSNNSVSYGTLNTSIPLNGIAAILNQPSLTTQTISFDKDMTKWDNAPGGNRNDIGAPNGLYERVWKAVKAQSKEIDKTGPSGGQCFIPTVSALDLATDDMHTNAGNFVGDVNIPRNTPFKRVFISTGNEAHVFMSQSLLDFARNEIVANTKISCSSGPIQLDPNLELELPGVGVNPGVNPGVGKTGGMKVIGAEPIGAGLQIREGAVATPIKDDGDNKDN
jgi:hypothetical protein